VNIKKGALKDLSIPGGFFYAARSGSGGRDLVILKAEEPSLRWHYIVEELFTLCERIGVEDVITLGSMIDNVLHSDRIVSGFGSSETLLEKLEQKNVPHLLSRAECYSFYHTLRGEKERVSVHQPVVSLPPLSPGRYPLWYDVSFGNAAFAFWGIRT